MPFYSSFLSFSCLYSHSQPLLYSRSSFPRGLLYTIPFLFSRPTCWRSCPLTLPSGYPLYVTPGSSHLSFFHPRFFTLLCCLPLRSLTLCSPASVASASFAGVTEERAPPREWNFNVQPVTKRFAVSLYTVTARKTSDNSSSFPENESEIFDCRDTYRQF